jgi:hypothetical protein
MAAPVGDPLRALVALLGRFDQTVARGDDDQARGEAADQIDQLRAIAAAAMQGQPAGGLDLARLDHTLAVFAGWLRAPDSTSEAEARRAMADLESAFRPLFEPDPAATAAERAHYQRQATASIEAYLRAHPIEPMRLPAVVMPPTRELPDLSSFDPADDPDEASKP